MYLLFSKLGLLTELVLTTVMVVIGDMRLGTFAELVIVLGQTGCAGRDEVGLVFKVQFDLF